MSVPRFYCDASLPETGDYRLPDGVLHHATRVLRMHEGDAMVLFDGQGGEVPATLERNQGQWFARLGVRRGVARESPLEVVLVQALASGDKMDWIVQKAVELGACGVLPVRAERSVVRLDADRALKRVGHWRQVAIAACEQSGRDRVPWIAPVRDLSAVLREEVCPAIDATGAGAWVLDPASTTRLADEAPPPGRIHLLIGPEGGWSETELAACRTAGCRGLRLGPRILRTETAGLVAIAAVQARWGDI